MNKKFDFMEAISRLSDLLVVSVVFFFTCLPLVTVGPALTALYHTVVKVVRKGRGKVLQTYFSCFRSNFRQGFCLGLICLGYLLVGLADVYLLQVFGYIYEANQFFYVISWLYLLPLAVVLPWLFSYLSRFDDTVSHILKNAVVLGITNIGKTLICLVMIGVCAVICWTVPVLVFIIAGPLCMMISGTVEPVFRELTREQKVEAGVDDWYNE